MVSEGVSEMCRVRVPGCCEGGCGFGGADEEERVRDPRLDDEPLKISGPRCGQIGAEQIIVKSMNPIKRLLASSNSAEISGFS